MENNVESFAEVREFIKNRHSLVHDEPFIIGCEYALDNDRRQGVFLAELQAEDGHRYLRIESTVLPLEKLDAEKCLRMNLMQRVGYLAVGDLDAVPYIKMCENLSYRTLDLDELLYTIDEIARAADRIEDVIGEGEDFS